MKILGAFQNLLTHVLAVLCCAANNTPREPLAVSGDTQHDCHIEPSRYRA
jgi:hypothetical protein